MCSVQPDELHDKSAARQTPPRSQRGCPSVLPSISAILGQQQLPNATMSRVDFLIYSGTKFSLKILLPPVWRSRVSPPRSRICRGGRGRGNIRVFQCLISLQCWWVLWGPKRSKCAPHRLQGVCLFSRRQQKYSLINFSLFTLIELIHIGCFEIFIFISKLCAVFYAGYVASPCIYFLCWQADLFPCEQMNCLLFRQNTNILFGILL